MWGDRLGPPHPQIDSGQANVQIADVAVGLTVSEFTGLVTTKEPLLKKAKFLI